MQPFTRARAQALVEFALAATLIFFLLAAAVDLGLLFFTKQGITAAAQEGAGYGSRWLIDAPDPADSSKKVRVLNVPEIQNRVRFESGSNGGNGILKLTDLNVDGIDDSTQPTILDSTGKTGWIQVSAVQDTNTDGDPTNDGGALCKNPASSTYSCYAVVTIKKNYNLFFPLSPALSKQTTLSSTYYVLIRDSYQVSSTINQPKILPPTPSPSATQLKLKFIVPNATDGQTVTGSSGMQIRVQAYDSSKTSGTDGVGISKVDISLADSNGNVLASKSDSGAPYCLFGGGCSAMPNNLWNSMASGATYRLVATATSTDGNLTNTITVYFKKP